MEHSDGGILDLDDVLCDVADDKDRVSDAVLLQVHRPITSKTQFRPPTGGAVAAA